MLYYDHERMIFVGMHYEKLKALMKRKGFWWKEKLFFKDKSFWSFVVLWR